MDFVPKTLPTPLHLGRVEEAIRQVLGNIPGTSTLPVDNPTIPFWSSQPGDNPLSREGADGPLPDQVDICIIGSGITGVGFAYHISELLKNSKDCTVPLKVLILEARDFCTPFRFLRTNGASKNLYFSLQVMAQQAVMGAI